jgi:hypothetical protein
MGAERFVAKNGSLVGLTRQESLLAAHLKVRPFKALESAADPHRVPVRWKSRSLVGLKPSS